MSTTPRTRSQMESELQGKTEQLQMYCRVLRQLHDLQMRHHARYAEQCRDYLEVGCSVFGMSTGIVSYIHGDTCRIDAVHSPLPDLWSGREFPLEDTLCAQVIREERTVAIPDLRAEKQLRGHPAFRDLHLRSYLAAPIRMQDGIYGTLNFSSETPRDRPFDEYEIEILDLMAESMARFLDLRNLEEAQRRMRQEQAAREARQAAQLDRSERMATLGLVATGVAHEINNPLQGMRSHLSAVRRAVPEDFERMESLKMVEKGIQNIAGIVKQLLALQSPESQGAAHCVLSDAVEFVAKLLAPDFRKHRVRIMNRVTALPKPVGISQQHLTQVLLNLLINARDAMPDGGEVRVDAEQNNTETHVWVTDTGKGFDPERAETIFAPFYTTKGAHGTGLGLTVAESLVRNVKGRIYATSVPGQGSVFHLHVPNAR